MKRHTGCLCAFLAAAVLMSPVTIHAEKNPEMNDGVILINGDIVENRWVQIGDNWYKTDEKGKIIKNKWIASGKQWYYLTSSGVMAVNTWHASSGGRWYYLNDSGAMAVSPTFIDGKLNGFNQDGTWQRQGVTYKEVPIVLKGEYSEDTVSKYLNWLTEMPDHLVKIPGQYVFTSIPGTITGITYYSYSINTDEPIYRVDKIEFDSMDKAYKTTIPHELIHALDAINKMQLSDDEEFRMAVQEEMRAIRSLTYYKGTAIEEMLAYLTVEYLTDSELVSRKAPKTAAYIQAMLEAYNVHFPSAYFIEEE